MNSLKQSRYLWFYVPISVLLVSVIIFLIVVLTSQTSLQQPAPSPTPAGTIGTIHNRFRQVLRISPEEYELLTPEKQQRFSVVFTEAINPQTIRVKLRQSSFLDPLKREDVQTTTDYIASTKTLYIRTIPTIVPQSTYDLTITERGNGNILLQARYHSPQLLPTPVPSINNTLKPYLPHETETYRLVYNQLRNVYVFNLKLDAASADNFDTQFQKAKTEAIQFIQSKGIDPNTLMIEYRRS